jgi:hypothetical protein
MFVQRARPYVLLFLILVALQQGCKTADPPQPSGPEPVQEPATGASTDSGGAASTPGNLAQPETTRIEPGPDAVSKPSPQARELLPESVLRVPDRDAVSPGVRYDTVLIPRASESPVSVAWQYRKNRQNQIVGFEFSNPGGNRILPQRYAVEKNHAFTRDFCFRFDERARQDIHLLISDWAPSRDRRFRLSEIMNSILHFFPRNYLPTIARSNERNVVTLPTGELVEFDARTHEVVGGVFLEVPVDLNPDHAARNYPGVHYLGKGVVVRADSRGKDPRVGTVATITAGSLPAQCKAGTGCDQCRVPAMELWDPKGAARFKYTTDEEFDRYLQARCGFGLPKDGSNFVVESPLKGTIK